MMQPIGHLRKRIWEVDCISMDTVLAASFEWREMCNLLQSVGCRIEEGGSGKTEMTAQCTVHHYCHAENRLSLNVENILNLCHKKTIQRVALKSADEIMEFILDADRYEDIGGLMWAVATEKRPKFECVRRRLQQKLQVLLLRSYSGSRKVSV